MDKTRLAFDLGVEALSDQPFNESLLLEPDQFLWKAGSSVVLDVTG